MGYTRFFLIVLFVLSNATGFYCHQIPADCGCPGGGYFMQCNTDVTDGYCYRAVSCMLLGRLFAHPDDTSKRLINANHGQIGKFIIDDVILNRIDFSLPLKQGDTIETGWGGSCYSWYRPDSLQTIVSFGYEQQITYLNHTDVTKSDYDTTDCFFIPGCGMFILRVDQGVVKGNIDKGISEMPYHEFKERVIEKTALHSKPYDRTEGSGPAFSVRYKGRRCHLSINRRSGPGISFLRLFTLDGRQVAVYSVNTEKGRWTVIDVRNTIRRGMYIMTIDGVSRTVYLP